MADIVVAEAATVVENVDLLSTEKEGATEAVLEISSTPANLTAVEDKSPSSLSGEVNGVDPPKENGDSETDKQGDEKDTKESVTKEAKEDINKKKGAGDTRKKREETQKKEEKKEKEEVEENEDENAQEDDDKVSAKGDDDSSHEEEKKRPLIPQVTKLDFEHFKNRYSSEEDGHSIIEVLEGGSNMTYEYRRLEAIRKAYRRMSKEDKKRMLPSQPSVSTASAGKSEPKWIQRVRIQSRSIIHHLSVMSAEESVGSVPITFMRPFRMLIYFQPRMKEILAKLEARWADYDPKEIEEGKEGGDSDGTGKAAAKKSKKAAAASDLSKSTRPINIYDQDTDFHNDAEDNPEMYDWDSLLAMRCYVEFVDAEIMPLYTMFVQPKAPGAPPIMKVRFTDLWLLFRFGELVYASASSGISPRHGYGRDADASSSQATLVWRVYSITCPSYAPNYSHSETSRKPRRNDSDSNSFAIWAYYIDWDGSSYGPVKHVFRIAPFDGEMDIRQLPCYPVRYVDDDRLLETLREDGRKFRDCVERRNLAYEGWTASPAPTGKQTTDDEDEEQVRYPEYVDSHVIVDFVEAFQVYPLWKPEFHNPGISNAENWDETEDAVPLLQWDAEDDVWKDDIVQSVDAVAAWQRKESLEVDGFVKSYKAFLGSGSGSGSTSNKQTRKAVQLRDEDLVLLPRRLFAYILRDRKFAPVDVRYLQAIPKQQNVFDSLKIFDDYRDIVKGLVSSHFVHKNVERKFSALSVNEKAELLFPGERTPLGFSTAAASTTPSNIRGMTQDLIQGKGRGLVILLHGVPGVGKTATAEAVALEYQKPLFVITCGDLGLTPSDVERHLTEVFRLAHLWDCVLLLDEADVFLSSRDNLDLNRNALVSVFLRVLEYYSGILFLTTNRVGHLDGAFRSRIHVSLYYPELTKRQAHSIFRMNIERLDKIALLRSTITKEPKLEINAASILDFANELFDRRKEGNRNGAEEWMPWNGRQIRNAFQIASSLAYDMYSQSENQRQAGSREEQQPLRAPLLNRTQFEVISRVVDSFENYMLVTRGKSEKKWALDHGERADVKKAASSLGLDGMRREAHMSTSQSYAASTTPPAGTNNGYSNYNVGRNDLPRTPDSRPLPGDDMSHDSKHYASHYRDYPSSRREDYSRDHDYQNRDYRDRGDGGDRRLYPAYDQDQDRGRRGQSPPRRDRHLSPSNARYDYGSRGGGGNSGRRYDSENDDPYAPRSSRPPPPGPAQKYGDQKSSGSPGWSKNKGPGVPSFGGDNEDD